MNQNINFNSVIISIGTKNKLFFDKNIDPKTFNKIKNKIKNKAKKIFKTKIKKYNYDNFEYWLKIQPNYIKKNHKIIQNYYEFEYQKIIDLTYNNYDFRVILSKKKYLNPQLFPAFNYYHKEVIEEKESFVFNNFKIIFIKINNIYKINIQIYKNNCDINLMIINCKKVINDIFKLLF